MPNGTTRDLEAHARATIRKWMASYDMSQEDFAARIGRAQVWVSRYLAGKRRADLNTLGLMAAVFGRDVSALLSVATDPAERDLVSLFHAADADDRKTVMKVLKAMTRGRRVRGARTTTPR